ncbi:hypothetical protein [uncultured Methanobrevibacter sp.]|uniref:hypothetical protein n=1 Tax=uncultured Methanobrevibacter sp. TaxID=253161 RepID=UPI0025F8F01C|nr:hypothetical protein [uncultured Methanobrevibacter sp.]
MKYKYPFAVMLILTMLFLLGSATAIEDMDLNVTSSDEAPILDIPVSEDMANVEIESEENPIELSSADSSDLSVEIKLGDVKKTTFGINEMNFDVPLIITAKNAEGVAKNSKVFISIPEEFEIASYNATHGLYSSESGIWNIGNLDSTTDAVLTIFTTIKQKGSYLISLNATTDSNDSDMVNNYLGCTIEVTSKISSNVTRTSADRSSTQHTSHYASTVKGTSRGYSGENIPKPNQNPQTDQENENQHENENDPNPNENGGNSETNNGKSSTQGQSGEGSSSSQGEIGISNVARRGIRTSTISNAFTGLGNVISDLLNPDSGSDKDSYSPSRIVKAIQSNNYITIPIAIFVLFVIILAGNYAYEKIRP